MIVKIDEVYTWTFPVHDSHGALVNADALPTATVFEDDGDASIDSPPVEQVGAITGWYRVIVDVDSAIYTVGKSYNVHVNLDVGGISMGAVVKSFIPSTSNIDTVDGVVDAIKLKTDKLTFDGSDRVSANVTAMDDGVLVASKFGLGAITADKIAASALDNKGNWSKAGDEMDLVNAPNATAVAAIQSGLATSAGVTAVEAKVDTSVSRIGTPVALDSGDASIAGMLTKMADDNGGADFDAGTDSLHEIAAAGGGGGATAQAIWEYIFTGYEPTGSAAETLVSIKDLIEGLNNLSESDIIRIVAMLQRRFNPNGGFNV